MGKPVVPFSMTSSNLFQVTSRSSYCSTCNDVAPSRVC